LRQTSNDMAIAGNSMKTPGERQSHLLKEEGYSIGKK